MRGKSHVSSALPLEGERIDLPIFSVPTVRTSKKQKGKSSTDSAKYTPTAVQPYSLDSFLSLPLKDSDSWLAVFSFVELLSVCLARDEWICRLGPDKGLLNLPKVDRVGTGFEARSCDINALLCHGATGTLVVTLLVHTSLPRAPRVMLLRAAFPPTRASNAPNAVRSMVAGRRPEHNRSDRVQPTSRFLPVIPRISGLS